MSEPITFNLNGREVQAVNGETIWEVSKRYGEIIPHLCHRDKPGYRVDANCRVCVVEIDGERTLAPSCRRTPTKGMNVNTNNERSVKARNMVLELLLSDQPEKKKAHDPKSLLWNWLDKADIHKSRFPIHHVTKPDNSHIAMSVNLDACIHCNLCVRACREVQVNDVIGMSFRGAHSKITFDFADPMGESTCVACGECVQACPTGALMPSNLLDDKQVKIEEATRDVNSLCPYCGVGCQVKYHVQNDKIVHVEGRDGPANENRLCVKGRFGFDYARHSDRLKKPLIRRADAPKNGHDKLDPSNPFTHFREASWAEALDAAAQGLKKIRNSDGPDALAGFGSAKGSNEEAYLVQKLVRQGFGTNNVDHCTRLCHASSVAALMEGVNSGAVTAPFTAASDADCIITIGCRPTENHPVAATYIKSAAKKGATLIVMDPRKHGLTRHADHMLQFKPGSDVALLGAMIATIIEEDLTDKQYIQGMTEGFDEIKENAKNFKPEKIAAVCGIDAQIIREVARIYAKSDRSIIFWGMGISQHIHGTDNARCLISLAMITGQIGRPGTGLHPLRGQNNVQGASDAGLIPMVFPDYKSVESNPIREMYEKEWGTGLPSSKGLTVVEIMDAVHENKIKGMYIMGENPAMSDPDVQHARDGLAKLEHLVVQDIFLTETCFHADVILPASVFAEKTGTFTNTNRQIQMARPALNTIGEAQQDWWIIKELANRIGLNWTYESPKDIFQEMKRTMRSLDNISWVRLESENAVTYPCSSENVPGDDIIFSEVFPTTSGRARLVPAQIVPPAELPDKEYPLVLTTGRVLEHWHTGAMTRRAETLNALEKTPIASLHPKQLKSLCLVAGDKAQFTTRRGSIKTHVRADRDVPEGMVFMPFCYHEAAANILTNPQLDPIGKIPEFKFCAVKVENISSAKN